MTETIMTIAYVLVGLTTTKEKTITAKIETLL